jgi:hypothetical protein
MSNFAKASNLVKGPYEYPEGFLVADDVVKVCMTKTGNTIALDNEGHLFDVHPKTNIRYNKTLGKNEDCDPCYPVRWQLRSWDATDEIKEKFGLI